MPAAVAKQPPVLDLLLPDPDAVRARIEALESEARDARALLRLILRRQQEREQPSDREEAAHA
jgi:hypothetical protein